MEQSAADLARRARDGDAGAFEELIRRYERVALSVAYSVLRNAADAGDATQEAFLRAWQRLGDLNDPEKFGSWLCNIVRNLSLDMRRRTRPMSIAGVGEMEIAGEGPMVRRVGDPADAMLGLEERDRIKAALDTLDDETRSAVIMRYYDGCSSKEIAAALDMNPAAIDMRLSRARKQLKDWLAPADAGLAEARVS